MLEYAVLVALPRALSDDLILVFQHSAMESFKGCSDMKLRIVSVSVALAITSFLLYARAIHFGFIGIDDYSVLQNHPYLYDETSLINSIRQIFLTAFPREEPLLLRDLFWAIDSRVFGFTNPLGYHLGNILLNSLNCALVFILVWKMHRRFYMAVWIAVLFAAAPVHVEPVCWVMGRKDLLVSFFMLTALILQTTELTTSSTPTRRQLYLLGILVTIAALLSKINALSFFMVLALHRFFFPYLTSQMTPSQPFETGTGRRLAHSAVMVIPHALISIGIYFWYKGILTQWGILDRGVDSLSLYHLKNLILFTPLIIGRYLQLIFFPGNFRIYYDWPSIFQTMNLWDVGLSVVLSAIILLMLVHAWRRHKDICFYLMAFLALMIPYFNIMYIGIWLANRYVYFSSFCLLTAAYLALERVVLKNQPSRIRMACVVMAAVVVIWAGHTWFYQKAFKDDHSLWRYETGLKNPSLMAYSSMADVLVKQASFESDPELRKPLYEEAGRLISAGFDRFRSANMKENSWELAKLYYLQGILARKMEQPQEKQLACFEKAYELNPREKAVIWNLADVLFRLAVKSEGEEIRQQLAGRSLELLENYLRLKPHSENREAKVIRLMEAEYASRFPFLQARIETIRLKNLFHEP